MSTSSRFTKFLENIQLTDVQVSNGKASREAVVGTLNSTYYGSTSNTNNSVYVGSWAKFTRIRPPRDVDVLYDLPKAVYDRFQLRTGNRQSQLLQEVKAVLLAAYPNTLIRGDGPIVIVPFATFSVEVIPSFKLTDGKSWVCLTEGGGRYKTADYAAEASYIADSDTATNGKTRHLVRMMKRWQAECSVPIKSFHIELTSALFLANWVHKGESRSYYDCMVRDYLAYLVSRANGHVYAPGTGEQMALGEAWLSRAKTALDRATKACTHELTPAPAWACEEWRKIFGADYPSND
ncbi:SMODS domain-containing nucleotidyltransferase [Phenylobacterium montanum]|uniref:Nucleotidyltransferase n=1 Tax=Phenylobacterium montanum TaxID=2823693 RepID=A0A975IXW6_9CAUL|nr:nucleotidyltransferase [Caulobacter sp. S6]QUD89851.1 hypothetical protein KCG34_08270 [Caulobacter sp. S6]